MIKVYIASPYTGHDPDESVEAQVNVGNCLIDLGFNPFMPLLSHYLHIKKKRGNDKWLHLMLQWLLECQALLRLPGNSSGADIEENFAKALGIPIFYTIKELSEHFGEQEYAGRD